MITRDIVFGISINLLNIFTKQSFVKYILYFLMHDSSCVGFNASLLTKLLGTEELSESIDDDPSFKNKLYRNQFTMEMVSQ